MAIQLSVAVREARLNAIETTIGTSAILEVRSGAVPANCAAADSGTLLASMSLASDWMAAAGTPGAGQKGLLGTWSDPTANNAGTAGHFRIKNSAGTVCGLQGTCSGTGGGGDLQFDNPVIEAGQLVTVSSFTLTDGNA
jgi:hypothetical protein